MERHPSLARGEVCEGAATLWETLGRVGDASSFGDDEVAEFRVWLKDEKRKVIITTLSLQRARMSSAHT